MSRDELGIRAHADETAAGLCAILAALVVALDENGVLPRRLYCEALRALWIEMPAAHALGAGGEMIEQVLDLVGVDDPSSHEVPESAFSAGNGVAANDDAAAHAGAPPRLVGSP